MRHLGEGCSLLVLALVPGAERPELDWWGGPGGINDVPRRMVPAIGKFEAWWEERSKLWADGVVTISTVLRQRALNLGCPPERVLYLPTGGMAELNLARILINLCYGLCVQCSRVPIEPVAVCLHRNIRYLSSALRLTTKVS